MAKTYQISNNIIFCVNDDGSITKFATISESGEICRIGETISNHKVRKVWGYWVAILILIIGVIVFGVLYSNAMSDYRWQVSQTNSMERKYNESQEHVSSLESEKSSLESAKESAEEALSMLKQKVGDSYPIIISDIEIANSYKGGSIETDFGNTIYSSNTMYLKPRITYYGISSGTKTLKVKWFKPDGSISTGTSSPYGFSQSDSHYIYSGADNTITMSGWGNENKGHWRAGTYRIEIWYGNICLKSKTFTIY
ncbi:MAG: hypothetical protein K1V84_09885 [Muribaculaceae bacterium]